MTLPKTTALWLILLGLLQAQTAPEWKHESSQGVEYLPVPGTTVLFSKYETRVKDFQEFASAGTYPWSFRPHFQQSSEEPVVGTNLQDAVAYCNWLTEKERADGRLKSSQGYRLPTTEEWSAAAGQLVARKMDKTSDERVDDVQRYVWGMEWPPPAGAGNFQQKQLPGYVDDYVFTAPVGKFKPTPDGLYDLAGNVWEWTWDRQLNASTEGKLRGGSWAYFRKETLLATYTYLVPADLRAPTVGFRCVYEDKQRTAELLTQQAVARKELDEKRMADLKGKVDKEASDRVIKMAQQTYSSQQVDVSKLTAATVGQPFTSATGLAFLPLTGVVPLVGKTEVPLSALAIWSKEAKEEIPSQPSFNTQPDHPAVNLTWSQAQAFCDWLTTFDQKAKLLPEGAKYRLPTDAEWSIFAGLKEGPGTPSSLHLQEAKHFPWGEAWPPQDLAVNLDAPKVENYRDSFAYTSPVAKFLPNSQGLHDLGGNVSEWVQDAWPEAATEHVIRGGSWLLSERLAVLSSSRQHRPEKFSRYDLGFRCVLELKQP